MLHDVQESALTYQAVEIAYRVAAEFLVVEFRPEPIMQAIEPGKHWAWCFVDDMMLN
jgi:hypothetical protein